MEGCPRNDESCQKLLDLMRRDGDEKRRHGCETEEKKLELRLGPPGDDEDLPLKNSETRCSNYIRKERQEQSLLSIGYFSSSIQNSDNKPFSSSPASNTAVHRSQKRTAPGPVVGWPPIRSLRKNLGSSSSSKPGPESAHAVQPRAVDEKPVEPKSKGLFVKINMDGVPIGRKVDLNAHGSYEKLASAVDDLFRGLLAVSGQRDSFVVEEQEKEEKPITGLLDGMGEYTLVYEDYEGDTMLVGDVPWHIFVSTVKRLRVLRSSDLSSALTLGSRKQEKMPT